MSESYEDIINLPHHVSSSRPRMSLHDRAAQFAPFAALNGHADAIEQTAARSAAHEDLEHETIEEDVFFSSQDD